MKWLEKRGFKCSRAAASLGVFDVIGIGESFIVLAQVKTNGWGSLKERHAIENFMCPSNSFKILVRWNDYARAPKVLLWYETERKWHNFPATLVLGDSYYGHTKFNNLHRW